MNVLRLVLRKLFGLEAAPAPTVEAVPGPHQELISSFLSFQGGSDGFERNIENADFQIGELHDAISRFDIDSGSAYADNGLYNLNDAAFRGMIHIQDAGRAIVQAKRVIAELEQEGGCPHWMKNLYFNATDPNKNVETCLRETSRLFNDLMGHATKIAGFTHGDQRVNTETFRVYLLSEAAQLCTILPEHLQPAS
jgi:hypothetical protein